MIKEALEGLVSRYRGHTSADEKLTSIVILSYNRPESIRDNIASLREHTSSSYEVVIFDNGSDKETVDYLDTLHDSTDSKGNGRVNIIKNRINLGCSGGRNEAIKHAAGDYVVTMDDDMTYTPQWLDNLIERIEESPDIGAATCKIVFPNGVVQWNGGRIEQEFEGLSYFLPIDYFKKEDDASLSGEMDCDWICGGATIMKREVLDQVEHKSQDIYPNGYEDYDYSLQIRQNGWRIVNAPKSTVYHHHLGYDPRLFIEQVERNPKYVKTRRNRETLHQSVVGFLSETGIDLFSEYFGSPRWHKAMETSLDHLPKATRARLAREEVRRRGAPLKDMPGMVVPKVEYHEEARERIRSQYGFSSLDIEDIGIEGIEKIIDSYNLALATHTGSFDKKAIARSVYQSLVNAKRHIEAESSSAFRYVDLDTGVIANEGILSLVNNIQDHTTPINADFSWSAYWLGWIMTQNELKYITVNENPIINKSEESPLTVRHYSNGIEALGRGEFEPAVQFFERVLEAAPEHPWAWYDRSAALLRMGRIDESLQSIQHALRLDDTNAEAWEIHNRITTMPRDSTFDLQTLDELVWFLKEAQLDYPSETAYNAGVDEFRLGKYESAVEFFDRVIAAKPRYAWAHHDKGFALLKLGRYDEARQSLEQAINLNPDDEDAQEQLTLLIE